LTNFVRSYGSGKAVFVILIDAGKAVLACLVGRLLLRSSGMALDGTVLGGFCVMIGHMFPILLGFKGGKGILSGLFVALMVDWRIAVLILAVFALVYFTSRYVSLASVLAAVAFSAGFAVFHRGNWRVILLGVTMGALAVYMHRSNIVRLIRGEERKTNLFKK
jgi:glycerol-3-phosphate acyltransferase PlsY